MRAALELPPEPLSARQARHFVASTLAQWGLGDLEATASLLASEVVTNAILHAGTDLILEVATVDGGVRVEVHDGSGRVPRARHYGLEATTGRGLGLLEVLAAAWGVEPAEAGKTVWFRLSTDGSATADPELAAFAAFDLADPALDLAGPVTQTRPGGGIADRPERPTRTTRRPARPRRRAGRPADHRPAHRLHGRLVRA